MFMRIFRALVCSLLICCLVINISPIRAKAVEPVTMVMVSAATVIASVMIGIGVMMGQNREAFDQVVQMVQGSSALKDFIQQDATKGDVIPLYRSPGTGGVGSGALSLLVAGVLIEVIRDYLWESGTLTEDSTLQEGYVSCGGYTFPLFDMVEGRRYCIFIHDAYGSLEYVWTDDPLSHKDNGIGNADGIGTGYSSETMHQYTLVNGEWIYRFRTNGFTTFDVIYSSHDIVERTDLSKVWLSASASDALSGDSIGIMDGLAAGEIAPQEQELSEGYSDWVAGSQWDVNNSQWWPIAVAPTYEETVTFPQEQVQKGEGTLKEEDLDDNTDPEPDSDQVTASGLKGWIDGLKDRITLLLQPLSLTVSNILDAVSAIPEAIVSPIKDFFTPSGNVDSYAIDLTSFFPFCIPFDLYDFLSLLLAEPEAPHFEFDIDFPYMNEPWHLVIDLSPWDGVAQLLRRLELLLFIVGLGMVTREKFLRG